MPLQDEASAFPVEFGAKSQGIFGAEYVGEFHETDQKQVAISFFNSRHSIAGDEFGKKSFGGGRTTIWASHDSSRIYFAAIIRIDGVRQNSALGCLHVGFEFGESSWSSPIVRKTELYCEAAENYWLAALKIIDPGMKMRMSTNAAPS